MKKYLAILILFFLSSCGTTGHIIFYDFDAPKYDVEKELLNVINKDSAFVVPSKWKDCFMGDIYPTIYIYYQRNPEEIYRLRFTCDSVEWNSSSHSRIGLIGQFNGNTWRNESELNKKEKERIQKRLETEILSKVKYKYTKSDETKSCAGM